MEKVRVQTLDKIYKLVHSKVIAEFTLYSAAALLVPFLLGHPQYLVGTLVNMTLVLAALNLKSYKVLPVVLLPSMAVIARGLVFGPFTIFLVYMVPFIWIGNILLVFLIHKLSSRWLGIALGVILKAAFLYSVALLLIRMGILPKVFAVSMGMIQLYTALVGGILALGIQKIRARFR